MEEKHTNSKFPWTLAQLKDILKRHGKSCFHLHLQSGHKNSLWSFPCLHLKRGVFSKSNRADLLF